MATLGHLVVVVPGVGGSVLERRGKVVWDARLGSVVRRLARPGPLRLAPGDGVEAVGLAGPLGIAPFWTPFPGYIGLMKMLADQFVPRPVIDTGTRGQRNVLADIAGFPYDFRRSVAHASALLDADVRQRVEARRVRGLPHQVIVVAHSMGGLVARHWLATCEDASARCDLLVTLGTPHQGSPRALKVLAGGVPVLGREWRGASEILRTWPSLYELLPRYPAVLDGRAQAGIAKRPHELTLPGVDADQAGSATITHKAIDDGWATGGPAAGVLLTPFFGTGQPTLQAATWDGTELRFEDGTPRWLAPEDWRGDSTVPMGAAVPKGGDSSRWRPVACHHGWLVEVHAVADLVRSFSDPGTEPFLGPPAATVGGQVGLDVEADLLVAGQTAQLTVDLLDGTGQRVGKTIASPVLRLRRSLPGTQWVTLEGQLGDDLRWRYATPPLTEAGEYELEASAAEWLGVERPPVRELIGVVPPDDLLEAEAAEADDDEDDG